MIELQVMTRRVGDDGPTFADLVVASLDPFDNAQRGHLVQGLVALTIGGTVTKQPESENPG